MNLELKNIKVHIGLSEETYAYTASLYCDGRKIANVKNDGHGGPDYQHPAKGFTYDDIKAVDQWCRANLPRWVSSFRQREKHDTNLEMWCGQQVETHLIKQDMKKAMRSKVLFIKSSAEKPVYQVGYTKVRRLSEQHVNTLTQCVKKDHPNAVILNKLPDGEALDIYKAGADHRVNRS